MQKDESQRGRFHHSSLRLHHSSFIIQPSGSAAIRQLVSKAITTEGEIIDVFIAAGSAAPTAHDMPAQGNALGLRHHLTKP
jgi:hypothetical protein